MRWKLLPACSPKYRYLAYDEKELKNIPYYEAILDVNELYGNLPNATAKGLFEMSIALKRTEFTAKLMANAKNLSKQVAFSQAMVYGDITLAKKIYEDKANGIDPNALTEYIGAPKLASLYHFLAVKGGMLKAETIPSLLALIEMGDTSHSDLSFRSYKNQVSTGGPETTFLQDAEKLDLQQLRLKYDHQK